MNRQQYIESCMEDTQHVFHDLRPVLEYVRDDENRRVGVVLAFRTEENNIYFGWSKAHSKKDRFNREIGIAQAFRRAKPLNEVSYEKMLPSVKASFDRIIDRANHYYKDLVNV